MSKNNSIEDIVNSLEKNNYISFFSDGKDRLIEIITILVHQAREEDLDDNQLSTAKALKRLRSRFINHGK